MIKAHRPNCLCLSCMSSKSWEIKVCKQVVNELWFDSIVGLWFIAILSVYKLDLRYNLAHKTCGNTKETSCSHLPLLFSLPVPVCLSLCLSLFQCVKGTCRRCVPTPQRNTSSPSKIKWKAFSLTVSHYAVPSGCCRRCCSRRRLPWEHMLCPPECWLDE